MVVYSISDIEKLTGVKAHTLRIWEKRYNIVCPKRTETNIRYYLDEDLKKIMDIALLNRNGYRISKIAKMAEEERMSIVAGITDVGTLHEDEVDTLVHAMFELNEDKFNAILNKHINSTGIQVTMDEVIYPFLDKLSTMWFTGSIKGIHEKFVRYLIRRKLITAIDRIKLEKVKGKSILYLPEGEVQELSLLYLHYTLKSQNVQVLNLGDKINLEDLEDASNSYKPDWAFTFVNESYNNNLLQGYLEQLSDKLRSCTIGISGYQAMTQHLDLPNNIVILNSINDIYDVISDKK